MGDIPKHEIEQALALFYDGEQAPIITQRRFGNAAQELIDLANEAGIPIYENPELLEQLAALSIGDNIPPELYRLVAEILAFAFYVQGKTPNTYNDAN
ncbi:EscU/YscU/HrcU family type III secretion system export apparatus switch protein [Oceaniserpentilla sp. 4NH20-0058]|uniref:EscU/YscU/HrcU family type III secretion system export apparatus switch protein n=1 Tax=Oceaniserpentilla sp. 4NH20-0058 TaxID=3127660 RepID=UPI00310208EA